MSDAPLAGAGVTVEGGRHARSVAALLRRVPPGLLLAWLVILLAALLAVAPGLFTHYSPTAGIAGHQLRPPDLTHLLGTDELGRDLLSRVVHGAIYTLTGAFVAVAVGLLAGTALGLVAGSVGGVVDDAIMRVVDVLLAIPALLLSLSIIVLLGFGTVDAAIAVGVTAVARFARVLRSEVVSVRRTEYVEAAFGSGGTFVRVLWRHVLPNSVTAAVAMAAVEFGRAILLISTLGFLGYGAPPPTPEWGLLIAEGRNYIATAWWLTTFPGIAVVVLVLAANRISQSVGKRT